MEAAPNIERRDLAVPFHGDNEQIIAHYIEILTNEQYIARYGRAKSPTHPSRNRRPASPNEARP
jgi:hypothetical protein